MNRSRVTGDLTASGLLYADIANDRVGIGSTIPGNKLSLPDSAKIGLGNAEDLTIYHDGSFSRIKDTATNALIIQSSEIRLQNEAANETMAIFISDGASELYHNNLKKLETTSTGASIDYKLTVGGAAGSPGIINLIEGGALSEIRVTRNSDANSDLQFKTESGDGTQIRAKINYDKDFELVGNSLIIPDSIIHSGDTNTKIRFPAVDTVSVETSGSESLRVTSYGKVLIGSTNLRNVGGASANSHLQIEGTTANTSSVALINNQAGTGSPVISFGKTRGTSDGAVTAVADGDNLGTIRFSGADGTDLQNSTAEIKAIVNGSVSGNTIPTDIVFQTSATNGASKVERLRIKSDGKVGIGINNPTYDLHVYGTGNVTSRVEAVAGDSLFNLSNTGNGNWSGINFVRERSSGTGVVGGSIWMPSVTANNSALLYLQTQTASAEAGVDSALVDNNGVRLKLASQPGGQGADTAFSVEIGDSERFRINNSGAVLLGATSSRDVGFAHKLQLEDNDTNPKGLSIISNRNTVHASHIDFAKTRGTSLGSNTVVQDDDYLGHINFRGADGTDVSTVASKISGAVDGTPASNNIPGRLEFYTCTGGSSYERLRITSAGKVGIGIESPSTLLHIRNSTADADVTIQAIASGTDARLNLYAHSTGVSQIRIGDESDANVGRITYYHAASGAIEANSLEFITGDASRVLIASTGLVFPQTTNIIRTDSSDGSDNKRIILAAGGTNSQSRGSQIAMYGNEYSSHQGRLQLLAGNSGNTNGVVEIYTGGEERLHLEADGDLRIGKDDSNYGWIRGFSGTTGDMIIDADKSTTGSSGSNLILRTRGSDRLTIHADGMNSAVKLGFGQTPNSSYFIDILNATSAYGIRLRSTGNQYHDLVFDGNRSNAANALGRIVGQWNGNNVAMIQVQTGDDTTNKDDGRIRFYTSESGSSVLERMEIRPNGTVNIGSSNEVQLDASNDEILYLHGAIVGANVDFGYGMRIDLDDDATGSATSDRERGCALFQFNGQCYGGDTTDETRLWNVFSDVNCNADYDNVYGFYADVRTTHNAGTITEMRGVYGIVQNTDSGNITNMTGLYGLVQSTTGANSETVHDMVGVRGRVNMCAGSSTANATDLVGIWGNIDNDNNTAQATGGKCALFYGHYDKTTGLHNPQGIRIDTDVPNYFRGDLAIGDASNFIPLAQLHISSGTSGDCQLIIEADTDNNDENDNPRILFRQDGGENQSAIGLESNELVLYNSVPSGGITFKTGDTVPYTNGTEHMRIQANGEVAMKSNGNPTDALAGLHVQNGGIRVSHDDEPTGSYTVITSDASSIDSNNHRFSIYKTIGGAVTPIFAVDGNGQGMNYASVYSGRTRQDDNDGQPNYYRHGAHAFFAFSGRTDDTTNYRAIAFIRAWDAGDRGDRNIIYYADSNSDTTTCDYDQHQTFGVKADGSVHGLVRGFSGRVESDEGTPNSVYGTGRGGWYGYEGGSSAQVYMLAESDGSSSTYFMFARTGNDDIQWKHRTSDGRMYVDATASTFNGADYAEYFEWSDGNSSNEDRAGYTVVLKDESKIGIATAGDSPSSIIGVISAAPAIVGDGQDLSWRGKWKKDAFGREITTTVQYLVWNHGYEDDENGNRVPVKQPDPTDQMSMQNADTQGEVGSKLDKMIADGHVPQFAIDNNIIMNATRRVKDPLYDETKKYVPREFRQEWSPVGLVGKLIVRKGQVVGDRWIKMKDINDQLEQYLVR